jgi:hypothetical protein
VKTLSFPFLLVLFLSSCKATKSFLLGDPDTIPTVPVPNANDTAVTPKPFEQPAKPSNPLMKLPDGTLASQEYTDAYLFQKSGQLWRAHLTLEPRALSLAGSKDEAKLLLDICKVQNDAECIEKCNAKISGKPIETAFDKATRLLPKDPKAARAVLLDKQSKSGLAQEENELLTKVCTKLKDTACLKRQKGPPPQAARATENPNEVNTNSGNASDAARARELAMSDPKKARAMLEPKAKANKASAEELEVLCAICGLGKDTKCVAAYCSR